MTVYRFFVLALLLTACTQPRENRLLHSQSPYLREHADNPVHWQEWSDATLQQAKDEDKPLIVSIGYSACHWCHVMERETFMDEDVARIMNESFICVKVDREQLPDVDAEYVHASELLTGTAGWPLNAFALPDGRAFHTVTYYPKDAWMKLLDQILKSWKEQRKDLENQATLVKQNIDAINTSIIPTGNDLKLDLSAFLNNTPSWFSSLDLSNGGVKGSPKFPMPSVGELMLQHSMLTNDKRSQQWIATTLDAMMNGGLYDHLGGGFARYATDSLWQVPHFEKMLYDNGQLASLYSHAYKQTGKELYKDVIIETLSFIETSMTSPEGAFYSSIDADSEEEEGKYYKWTADELGEEALKYFKVVDGVLNLKQTPPSELKNKLLIVRNKRVAPSIDTKIITSWNAMMIVGFLDAFTATGDQHYLDVALKAATFLDSDRLKTGKIFRLPGIEGVLDDYAWLAKSYIHLYQATFDIKWINKANDITQLALKKFGNDNSPLLYYSSNGIIEYFDNVLPSSNSVFAEVLFLLGDYLQNEQYTQLATAAIEHAVSPLDVETVHIANWARLAEAIHFSPYQIAIVGERALEFSKQLQTHSLPPAIFLGGNEENLPLLENKLVPNKTMIYVCKNRTCKLPVDDPQKAINQIN